MPCSLFIFGIYLTKYDLCCHWQRKLFWFTLNSSTCSQHYFLLTVLRIYPVFTVLSLLLLFFWCWCVLTARFLYYIFSSIHTFKWFVVPRDHRLSHFSNALVPAPWPWLIHWYVYTLVSMARFAEMEVVSRDSRYSSFAAII